MDQFENLTGNFIYPGAARSYAQFHSRRSVVHSKNGIIACSQPLAAQAGLTVLKSGGNAMDAAVATAAALNVTEPCSTGIGGDMFCLYWEEKEKKLHAVNGSGRAPEKLTLQKCRELGIHGAAIPLDNINATTVPGAAAGWVDVIEAHGSGMPMQKILDPAIKLAEDGFPVSELAAQQWASSEELIKRASPNANEMLKKDGKAPRAGDIFRNPTLGRTFREVAEKGKAGFYEGRVADEIVKLITELGGVMTHQDLRTHRSTVDEPISMKFQGVEVWECPPNGQGIVALQAIGIIESLVKEGKISLDKLQHNSVEYLHVVIEALRLAFADGNEFIADPRVDKLPIKGMLDETYLADRAKSYNPKAANRTIKNGYPSNSSDTVYFSTSDAEGNACSFIISNYAGFGTAAIPKGCGFTLQNRGSNFTLKEGHLNCIAPHKRPYHTIIPAAVTKDGELHSIYGVMGGFMQPQGHVQTLFNMYLFGHNPQEALDSPRICVQSLSAAESLGIEIDENQSHVAVEEGISGDVITGLKKLGHHVDVVKGWQRGLFGRGQIIRVHRQNGEIVYSAGSDPRADGHAVPA